MVLQKAQKMIDNLKERPKDDKKLIAGGIAIIIVVILFFGWAYLFLNKIQNHDQLPEVLSEEQGVSLSEAARQAQPELQQGFSGFDELKTLRDQLGAQQSGNASVQYNESDEVVPLNPQ